MNSAQRQKRSGFTLIELLVVIAIIAIIAAILFPVFASVREKGRQATMLSNYEKIQRALGEFQLDQHRYPEVLFAYAGNYTGCSVDVPYGPNNHSAPKGLFPQFIKDPSVFIDPNSPDTSDTTGSRTVSRTDLNAAMTPSNVSYFEADSVDMSQSMADANTLNKSTYLARYQTRWEPITTVDTTNPGLVHRQLAFPNPPGDTYVTCTTYHVPKGVVLALFVNGSAKTIDSNKYLQETGGSDTNFWKITPSGH